MKKTLAFIIPSYNVEWCLKRAVDSVINSSCRDDIEIIIVNDGSQDGTACIAEKYTQKYPGTVSLIHKPNGGHGSAINAGTLQVSARYFKVLDADDWIITENLPAFVSVLKSCRSDVVLTPFHLVDMKDQSRTVWEMYCNIYEKEYSMSDILINWKNFERCLTFHGMTYRTNFYTAHRHELPENIFYEDQEFSSIPCCHAKSIYPVNIFIYQYLVGNSQQSVSDLNRIKRISHIQKVTENLLLYLQTNKQLSPAGKEYIRRKAETVILSYYVISNLIQKDKRQGRKQSAEFNQMIQQFDATLLSRTSKKYRLYLIMNRLHISYDFYQKLLYSKLYSILKKTHQLKKEC